MVVVSQPLEDFDQVLDGLVSQDYANLKTLFLLADEPGELPAQIRERIPDAFIRAVVGNPGFGPAANEVMRLVEGNNGFFLFMHDDVALDSNAVSTLVEELYRSNAGIVGPKLVDWNDSRVLQHVGQGVDRFGEVDSIVEPGEMDQEQHDAVRDVFCIPSACMLVRADLFKTLGGFEPTIDFHGDDLDLCWRAHLSGARVVVVPEARARHRERLRERRPDLNHRRLAANHRMTTVATMTGGARLVLVPVQLFTITVIEMIVGLFTGHFADASASMRALFGNFLRAMPILRRRRQVAQLRQMPYSEVVGLQLRGSARFASYIRTREQRQMRVDHSSIGARHFGGNSSGQMAAWAIVLVVMLVGSRGLIRDHVPTVGEFLPYPGGARQMLGDYWSGWWGHGLGATTSIPTGIALIGGAGVALLGKMSLLHTVAVIGWLPLGYLGAWRLLSIFPSSRARLAGLVAYAAIPVPYEAIAAGRWGVLATYGALPWIVHLLRRFAGIEPSVKAAAVDDVVEDYVAVSVRQRVRIGAQLALLCAVLFAFAPAVVLIVGVVGVLLALATLVSRGSIITVAVLLAATVVAVLGGVALNLPWTAPFGSAAGWDSVVGAPTSGTQPVDLLTMIRFGSTSSATSLAIAFWLPVISAPLLARGWRLTWAARGTFLALAGLALAGCSSRLLGPIRLPEIGLFLAVAGLGAAIAAAAVAAAFEQDVQGGSFGWRQPLGILSGLSLLVAGRANVGGRRRRQVVGAGSDHRTTVAWFRGGPR